MHPVAKHPLPIECFRLYLQHIGPILYKNGNNTNSYKSHMKTGMLDLPIQSGFQWIIHFSHNSINKTKYSWIHVPMHKLGMSK